MASSGTTATTNSTHSSNRTTAPTPTSAWTLDYATVERIHKDRSINLQELRDANRSDEVIVGGDIEALVWWRSMVGDVERLEMWDRIQEVTA